MSEPQPTLNFGFTDQHSSDSSQECKACQRTFQPPYFQLNGLVICPACATAIEAKRQAPPHTSLLKAFVYGLGAAIAGSILYAAVAIITGLELALIAILIGFMVGKAIRHASGGLGGRPQQILAVLLTYFSITTSYIPVAIHAGINEPAKTAQQQAAPSAESKEPAMSFGQAIGTLLLLTFAAPFMSLTDASGFISLLIIFFGLQRAWRMTGRPAVAVTGPYGASPLGLTAQP